MTVLMVGVDEITKGGMWTVVRNYLESKEFVKKTNLIYVPTSTVGTVSHRLWFTFRNLIRIIGIFLYKKIDILHVHISEKGSVFRKNIVICIGKFFGAKIVIHMHGAAFESWYRGCVGKKQSKIRSILNKADKILILGRYWNEFISMLVERGKIEILYNAVRVREVNEYNERSNRILYLGVMTQRKGLNDILTAVKEENCLPDGYQVVLYGPDFDYGIKEKLQRFHLEDKIEYKGYLNTGEKDEVFGNTAINILPSYREGLPMTILETMAYGIPNITTDVAAIPEAVTDENGILIKSGDIKGLAKAIYELCSNHQMRLEKSKKAYETIQEKFNLEKHMGQLLRIYSDLLS
ncbi:MAG: glycosyltransferase family 4 protein [Lachnospiraceae bacterium]|jgi:glycosyltransferase involved in cell wall biosynthesis|nr:glycosyltransferase family 4 protein [Lachnospiraceae bacterium]